MIKRNKAFTLIELLVVIAITGILFGLLFSPLIKGFNLTRRAQTTVESQATARLVLESVSREIANAVYVFDNTSTEASVNVPISVNGVIQKKPLQFIKLDFIPPAQGFLDPTIVPDPTVDKPLGPLTLPLAPGITIVRYFIGLQKNVTNPADPSSLVAYTNTFEDKFATQSQGDNLFVLYRAEVRLTDDFGNVNTNLFDIDASSGAPIVNDPDFFYGAHAAEWRRASRTVVELERTDLIQLDRNTNIPTPLLSFTPQKAGQEPASAAQLQSAGIEVIDVSPTFNPAFDVLTGQHLIATENSGMAPTLFQSLHGGWTAGPIVTLLRTNPSGTQTPTALERRYYQTVYEDINGQKHLVIHRLHFVNGTQQEDIRQFDISAYLNSVRVGAPSFLNNVVLFDPNTSPENQLFMPYIVDPKAGQVITQFPSDVLMPAGLLSRTFDNDAGSASVPNTINGRYADLMRAFTTLDPVDGVTKRYELYDATRFMDLSSFNNSPLKVFYGSTIVPGSETVVGPDQLPGPHFGELIQYTRIPGNIEGSPGLNQYKINYVAKKPSQLLLTRITDLITRVSAANGKTPAELQTAIDNYYMPRFNVGYIEFASDINTPMANNAAANAKVQVTYEFQLNRPNDSVMVDYSTNQHINITLGLRRFDDVSPDPQKVIFSSSVQVRNYLR